MMNKGWPYSTGMAQTEAGELRDPRCGQGRQEQALRREFVRDRSEQDGSRPNRQGIGGLPHGERRDCRPRSQGPQDDPCGDESEPSSGLERGAW